MISKIFLVIAVLVVFTAMVFLLCACAINDDEDDEGRK